MGKRKLAKYLASKPEGEYSHLDKILKAYADGEAARLLSKYEFLPLCAFRKRDISMYYIPG